MAGSKTDYLENEILDHILGGGDYTRPGTVYIRLTTTTPTDSAAGTEVSTGAWTNYAPVAVTNNSTNFPAAASGVKSNGTEISFGTAVIPGAAVDVEAFEIWDASSGGNRLFWGEVTDSGGTPITKSISNDDLVKFAAGSLEITEN